jgi:hypothetical protein
MADIEYDGKTWTVPDDLSSEDQIKTVVGLSEADKVSGGASVPSFSNPMPSNQPVDYAATKGSSSIDPATLHDDQAWLEASKIIYKQHHGVDFDGTTQELADYGLNQISYFNYNTAGMAVDTLALKNAKKEEKQAFLYLMDTFDNLGYSWAGAGRFIGAAATDPLTYVGLGTLGIGTAAGAVGKTLGKAAVRSAIHASIEGAIATGIQSEIKQQALVNAEGQTEIDTGQVLKDTAIGAAFGGALGAGLGAIGSRFTRNKAGIPQGAITEPPRVMEPSLFKKATEVAPGADGPSVALGSKMEKAMRLEESIPTPAQSADIVRLTAEPMDPAERVLGAVHEISPSESLGIFPKPRAEVAKDSRVASELLINASKKDVEDLVTKLVNKATTPEQRILLNSSFRLATDQLEAKAMTMWSRYKTIENPADRITALKDLAQVEKMRDNVKAGDTLLSSYTGSDLSQRVGSVNTGEFRGVNEETFLREQGIAPELASPEQKDWAKEEYYSLVSQYLERAQKTDKVAELKAKIDATADAYLTTKDKAAFDELIKLRKEKAELALQVADMDSKEFGLFGKTKDFGRKAINDLNTSIISTVFAPSTLVFNTIPSLVKTVTKPALNWVVKGPTDEAARKEMLTFYHVMYNNIDVSWQMAKAAFQLERSLMMTETYANKYLESAQGTGILDNWYGRKLRIFPRLLSATDEFFQSLNYRGFVMGEAHHAALTDAANAGLAGAEKEAYVTRKLQEANDHLFGHVHHRSDIIDWTYEAGKAKGFKGDALDKWVKNQLDTRGHLMKEVNSESGARYVEDLLFKRKFSGEGFASQGAKMYEKFTNDHPIMRPLGQLFFRTPVRVFEEGIRMTPGLNLISPNFVADLAGKNGQARYARAMGEAMVGFAITQWIMAQYAAGNISGGGPLDYKQRRTLEESGWEPYTIKIGEHKITYRNYDPFSTPIKIVANMMERYSDLQYRQATGDFAQGADSKESMAMFGVAVGAVMQSIKDANLWDGINQIWQGLDKASDPEHKGFDQFMTHFLGQKAAYAVPSVVSKVQQIRHPELTNPATMWQYVVGKFDPSSNSVAHKYDALGNVMIQHTPVGKLFGVQVSDEQMRKAGHSDDEMAVLRELAKLSIAGNTNFVMPTRDKTMMPGIEDLRAAFTKDGMKTLYDRVNEKLKETNILKDLHGALVGRDDLPVASKLELVRNIISTHRKEAFIRLWSEHTGSREDFIRSKYLDAEGKAGLRDSKSLPFITE